MSTDRKGTPTTSELHIPAFYSNAHQTRLSSFLIAGSGKSSLGNVLLGREHNFKEENDVDGRQCFVAGEGTQGVTQETCAVAGRFDNIHPLRSGQLINQVAR